MIQLVVQFQQTHIFDFDVLPTGREIKDKLFAEEGVPANLIALKSNDCDLLDDCCVDNEELLIIRASLVSGLCGGKGGFGAQLRALAKQKAYRKTTDFGACRDLSGRRLRHVNDEILLQKWQEAKDKGESFDPTGETATGIDLWYLSAPSWAEGVKVDKRKIFMKPRMKTAMCIDWKRARENRPAPDGAPAHWGCPRGRRCEFAHGVEELRGESQQALLDAKQKEKRDAQKKKKDDYMGVLYRSNKEEEELEDLVLAGLRAAKRAKLGDAGAVTPAAEEDEVESNAEGSVEGSADSTGDEEVVSLDYFTALSGTVVVAKATPVTSSSSADSTSTSMCPILTGTSAFATVVVDKLTLQAPLSTSSSGKRRWYYEVELQSDGLMQLGWVDSRFIANFHSTQAALPVDTTDASNVETPAVEADGVGDDAHSWGFDGYRQQRWHGGEGSAYGPQSGTIWQAGDVVGCYLELHSTTINNASETSGTDKKRKASTSSSTTTSTTTGSISYSLNGVHYGTAFNLTVEFAEEEGELSFFPAFSLENSESVLLNLGNKPFKYSPNEVFANSSHASSSNGTSSKKATPAKGKKVASSEVEEAEFTPVWTAVLEASDAPSTSSSTDLPSTAEDPVTAVASTTSLNSSVAAATTSVSAEVEHPAIDLESDLYLERDSLEALGLVHLKQELARRGMKTGGTLAERAARLHSVRGVPVGKIDPKLLAKKA